jgi:hypothetical protein
MSATDELRTAAKVERDEWGDEIDSYPVASAIHLAVADLLDAHAGDWDASDGDDCCGPDDECFECSRNKAVLRVARAINDGAS